MHCVYIIKHSVYIFEILEMNNFYDFLGTTERELTLIRKKKCTPLSSFSLSLGDGPI